MISKGLSYLSCSIEVPLFKVSLPAVLHKEYHFRHFVGKWGKDERAAMRNWHICTCQVSFDHFHVIVKFPVLVCICVRHKGNVIEAESPLNVIRVLSSHDVVQHVQERIVPQVIQTNNCVV